MKYVAIDSRRSGDSFSGGETPNGFLPESFALWHVKYTSQYDFMTLNFLFQ